MLRSRVLEVHFLPDADIRSHIHVEFAFTLSL
jgi:hypothetical protein